jgi:hypothetical protein
MNEAIVSGKEFKLKGGVAILLPPHHMLHGIRYYLPLGSLLVEKTFCWLPDEVGNRVKSPYDSNVTTRTRMVYCIAIFIYRKNNMILSDSRFC